MPHTRPRTVYLLHFLAKHRSAQHYVGHTMNLEGRLADHAAGTGCVTTRRFVVAGIGFVLARTWPGDLKREFEIKRFGTARYCPVCRGRSRVDECRYFPPTVGGRLPRTADAD